MSEVMPRPKNIVKKPKRKGVPKGVMKIVEERSQGIDELYGFGSATDPHHIKHRSQGGLDIPINILHVGRITHNECHEKADMIRRTWEILNERILELFNGNDEDKGIYSHHQVMQKLQIDGDTFYNQIQKGFLKEFFPACISYEDILHWLMPKGWWVS